MTTVRGVPVPEHAAHLNGDGEAKPVHASVNDAGRVTEGVTELRHFVGPTGACGRGTRLGLAVDPQPPAVSG